MKINVIQDKNEPTGTYNQNRISRYRGMIAVLMIFFSIQIMAYNSSCGAVYSAEDSIKVEQLLAEAKDAKPNNAVLFFAKKFIGVPYVAKTLDRNADTERLVVNLKEMDCTTFVETTVALSRAYYKNDVTFMAFLDELSALRYEDSIVAYEHRNHYFTGWITSNTKRNAVRERQLDNIDVAQTQRVELNFMSSHPDFYPQLKSHPDLIPSIKAMEKRYSGGNYKFIPKEKVGQSHKFRRVIEDGDIIVITTRKAGLDCSHIGFAVWKSDGLHLLNASQIHGQVIEEPMTLFQYMKKHSTQTGIRAVEVRK